MHASPAARPVNLPWLSWIFLALLIAASTVVRTSNGIKRLSASAPANPAMAATR